MLTDQPGRYTRFAYLEAVLLLIAAPLLLFPGVFPLATAVVLLLFALGWVGWWGVNGRPFVVTPFNAAFLLWGGAVLVGILVTADPDLTLPKATGVILGLATWRFLAVYGRSHQQIWAAVVVFGLLGAMFALVGLFSTEWKSQSPVIARLGPLLPPRLFRFSETPDAGVSPNQLAATLIVYLPLIGSLLVGWRPARYRRIIRAGLILLAGAVVAILFLTYSRSGWFGGVIGLVSLFFFWAITLPPSRPRTAARLTLALMVGIGVAVLLFAGPQRLLALWEEPPAATALGNLSTLNFRKAVWPWAIQGIEDFPLTGTGLGGFRHVIYRFYPVAVPITYGVAHAHNTFLQVALDVGLPGLVAYLAILGIAGIVSLRVARQSPSFRPLVLGLVAGLFALHTFGLTDSLSIGSKPGIVFWYVLGLLTAVNQLSHNPA